MWQSLWSTQQQYKQSWHGDKDVSAVCFTIFSDLAFNNVAHVQSWTAWITVIKLGRQLAHHYGTRRGQSENTWRCLTGAEHNIFLCWLAYTEQKRMGDDYSSDDWGNMLELNWLYECIVIWWFTTIILLYILTEVNSSFSWNCFFFVPYIYLLEEIVVGQLHMDNGATAECLVQRQFNMWPAGTENGTTTLLFCFTNWTDKDTKAPHYRQTEEYTTPVLHTLQQSVFVFNQV